MFMQYIHNTKFQSFGVRWAQVQSKEECLNWLRGETCRTQVPQKVRHGAPSCHKKRCDMVYLVAPFGQFKRSSLRFLQSGPILGSLERFAAKSGPSLGTGPKYRVHRVRKKKYSILLQFVCISSTLIKSSVFTKESYNQEGENKKIPTTMPIFFVWDGGGGLWARDFFLFSLIYRWCVEGKNQGFFSKKKGFFFV